MRLLPGLIAAFLVLPAFAADEIGNGEVRLQEHAARGNVPAKFKHEKAIKQIPAMNPGEYFVPPDLTEIPNSKYGEMVMLGRNIIVDTQHYAKRYVGNGLNCSNCHLQEGRKPFAAPFWGAYPLFPQFRNKTRSVVTFQERVQDCFRYSMNGIAPTLDSPEIKAITAYAHWLSKGAPFNEELPGRGFARLSKPRDPSSVNGKEIYHEQCALCHGVDGQGKKFTTRKGYMFPPLWGPDSANRAAGIAGAKGCAQFVRGNMPLGKGWSLSDIESWDVCAYIWLQDRPWDPRFNWYFIIFAPPVGAP
jgi:thiosulfate dehydrogenase